MVLEGLKAEGRHGANPGERIHPQEFVVDLDVLLEFDRDSLEATVDYRALADMARNTVAQTSFELLESLAEAVARAKAGSGPVEVEVETLAQLDEALAAGADHILLDNPTVDLVREAVLRVDDPERLEISGGVSLDSVQSLVEAGARVISVGRITHSAPSLDISLEVTDVD